VVGLTGDDAARSAREWQLDRLDLDGYLERIGWAGPRPGAVGAPEGLELVRLLHRRHATAIPFENLDVLLGRRVLLDLDRVCAKLVHGRRGGYCHEHALLFAAAAECLGFTVDRVTARVRVGGDQLGPRTHLAVRIRGPGFDVLGDVGFGRDCLVEPVAWSEGAGVTADGLTHTVHRGPPDGWALTARRPGEEPVELYGVGTEPAHRPDVDVATHWTSTAPESPFVRHPMVVTRGRDGTQHVLHGRRISRRPVAGPATHEWIPDMAALGDALADEFGLAMAPGDVAALAQRLSETDEEAS
jgi:N-hydroxyarylamine O-acetyltransferase